MGEALIIDAVRTPRGRGRRDKGALAEVHPQELLAQTLQQLAERNHLETEHVDDVIAGCVTQSGEQGACVARNAVLAAQWSERVTGVSLNRYCGSGLQACNFAAMGVMSGQQDLVVGGGVESMSRVPMGSDQAGLDGNNETLRKKVFQVPQGISADLIASLEKFSREDLDAFAVQSQERAERAQKGGFFNKSLFAVRHPDSGAELLGQDEYPRHGTTRAALAELKPAFATLGASKVGPADASLDAVALARYPQAGHIAHVHTAGSSSGIVDGAAAVLFASPAYAKNHSLRPRARVRSMATFGTEPIIMLTATVEASQKALKKAGMQVRDIDLWEINEAFAVVPLRTIRALRLDGDRVNVNGGAIALGHPLGATGAILLGTALDELERRNLSTALITLCIGGGMGIATIIERI